MASLITLADLRTQSKRRADMENSNFLSDQEWNQNINNSAKELYDILTRVHSDYYFSSLQVVTTSDDAYPLPDDFYKLLGVDQVINAGTGQAISIKPFQFQERNSYTKFNQSGVTVNLFYIPAMQDLVNDADMFDGINGYEEYIIVDAAIKALQKEESDCSLLAGQKQALLDRINKSAAARDAGKPDRVTDIHQVDPFNYIQIPSRIRYRVLGDQIKFVQCYAFGTVYE